MNISLTQPLARAYQRMKRMLFQPFHAETWFVLGFGAFLAKLFTGSSSGANWNMRGKSATHEVEQGVDRLHDFARTLTEHPVLLVMLAIGLCAFGIVLLVLAWVSARAEFVLLDNVVHRRARFVEPWRRFGKLGRSLFLWRAGFSFAYVLPLAIIAMPFVGVLVTALKGGGFEWPQLAAMVLGIGIGGTLMLVLGWVCMLVDDFVVPLMYRHDENITQAWGRFLPLLGSHAGEFLAYTVFLVVLAIAVGLGIAIVGLGTCCILFVLMIVPYIGSVVLLPVHVTARALGPEYLAQFGPEWNVFPAEPADDVAPTFAAPNDPPAPTIV